MTKITIKASNLEITVEGNGAEAKGEAIHALLASLLGRAVGATEAKDEDEDEDRVHRDDAIDFVKANLGCTVAQVAEHFGMETLAAASMLADLDNEGVIVSSNGDRGLDGVTFNVPAEPTAKDETEEASSQVPESSAMPSVPEATDDNVLAFLRSDDRFEYRTYSSVVKHFAGFADNTLGALINAGQVTTKRRRADGETLYKAAAIHEVPAGEVAAAGSDVTPGMNVESVRSFLSGDPRYTSRTLKSIAKHFNVDREYAESHLGAMVEDDDLDRTTRRSDGEPLFSLA